MTKIFPFSLTNFCQLAVGRASNININKIQIFRGGGGGEGGEGVTNSPSYSQDKREIFPSQSIVGNISIK